MQKSCFVRRCDRRPGPLRLRQPRFWHWMSIDMNSLVPLWQGIPCTTRNLLLKQGCIGGKLCRGLHMPREFSLLSEVNFQLDIPEFAAGARITCSGNCINAIHAHRARKMSKSGWAHGGPWSTNTSSGLCPSNRINCSLSPP
jgi:hypothetical protein